eukprot:UN09340
MKIEFDDQATAIERGQKYICTENSKCDDPIEPHIKIRPLSEDESQLTDYIEANCINTLV